MRWWKAELPGGPSVVADSSAAGGMPATGKGLSTVSAVQVHGHSSGKALRSAQDAGIAADDLLRPLQGLAEVTHRYKTHSAGMPR